MTGPPLSHFQSSAVFDLTYLYLLFSHDRVLCIIFVFVALVPLTFLACVSSIAGQAEAEE